MPRPQPGPGPSQPGQPQTPRFRVLAPDVAKARSPKSHPDPSTRQQQPPPQPQPKPKPSLFTHLRNRYAALPSPLRRTFRVLRVLAPIVPIGMFFSEHVLQVMWVRGPSMTPYINENYEQMRTASDMVLVNMWPWGGGGWPWERKRRLERGMVVTFRSPANPSHTAIKRIVGLPGDRITTRDPCLKPTQIVPFNHVWLEGDAEDPNKSLDSNTYGPVSISLLSGRVMAVLWPRLRMLRWSDWENGVVEGDYERRLGENYRGGVRERVVKGAVDFERPVVE